MMDSIPAMLNRRDAYISVNMAPRTMTHKIKVKYFSILMKNGFMHICPRSYIHRDRYIATISSVEVLSYGLTGSA